MNLAYDKIASLIFYGQAGQQAPFSKNLVQVGQAPHADGLIFGHGGQQPTVGRETQTGNGIHVAGELANLLAGFGIIKLQHGLTQIVRGDGQNGDIQRRTGRQ